MIGDINVYYTLALGWVAYGLGTRPDNVIQQSRPAVPVTLRSSPIPPGRGRMVPSCYTKNSRRGDLSLAAAIQRGEALRQEDPPRTTVRHSSRKPICNRVSLSWPSSTVQGTI